MAPTDPTGAVLQAARAAFSTRGYAGTTMKSVAAAAGVAPDVVRSLYANKERLFAAAMRLPFDPAQAIPEIIAPGLDGMGERLVRVSLELLRDDSVRTDLLRALRLGPGSVGLTVATSAPADQVRGLSEFLGTAVVDRVVAAAGVPDARLRVSLITATLLGLISARYVLKLEPLASADDEQVVALIGPAIQDLLDPTVRPRGRA